MVNRMTKRMMVAVMMEKMVNHNHWQGFESDDDGDDAAATGMLMTSITVLMMMKQMSLTRKY